MEFFKDWEFKYVMLLFRYVKFNGKVKVVVKIVKKIVKKVYRDNEDFWLVLLD